MESCKKVWILYMYFIHNYVCCQVYDECAGITDPDIVVASKKSCAKYLFCDGENSYEAECLTGFYFNEKIAACDNQMNVKCDIVPDDGVLSIFDKNFSPKENGQQDTKSDKNKEIIGNSTAENNNFDKNRINSSLTEPTKLNKEPTCPPLKGLLNIKYIANPESCVTFYTCYNGNAISMLCSRNMYFNENSGKCETQMPESCKEKYTVRANCFKGVYDFVPHPTRCEYYFYCVNGYLMIMRCPNDFTWHFERGTCVHKSQSKCFNEKSVIYRNSD